MNLYKTIIENEVFPAMGCTEPIACAYAAALAAEQLDGEVEELTLAVDKGTYKNGDAVIVPFTDGAKGNLIAAALGAYLKNPKLKLELLKEVTEESKIKAKALCQKAKVVCLGEEKLFCVDVTVSNKQSSARAVLFGGHTHISRLEKNGKLVYEEEAAKKGILAYRNQIKAMPIAELLKLVEKLDQEDLTYIEKGIKMNLALIEKGHALKKTGYQLEHMKEKGLIADDLFYRTKKSVGLAIDARMGGMDVPAMTSGGSGNQGIITTLVPYIVGTELKINNEKILRSIALAHMINAYTKCYIGELSVICGCAMSSGASTAAAIVFQHEGLHLKKIQNAIDNIVGDLSGLICDGAKPGCAMKSVTSVDSALRSAFMALEDCSPAMSDGVVGKTIEESIKNLARITIEGMLQVDPTVLKILQSKCAT